MTTRRKVGIGVGVALLLGLLAFLSLREQGGDVVDVRVEEVGRRSLVEQVSATGYIEPKRSVDISADVSGRIVELPVEEGEEVDEGALLLRIDPTQFEAAVRRARAALSEARAREAQARADWVQAARDAERLEELQRRREDLVTATEVEQATTRAQVTRAVLQAAEHGVEQAEAALAEAQDRLSKTTIRAPMTGVITRKNVEQGETAVVGTMNNPGSLLLTIADLSVMEAVVEVDETDIPSISIGDSASVEIDAFPNRRFSGRVTKIGNSSIRPTESLRQSGQEQAIDFEVRITLNSPPPGIRPDLSATSDVVTATRSDVLAIPITALTLQEVDSVETVPSEVAPEAAAAAATDREVEGVFVVADGTVRFRPVTVGVTGQSHFEVLSGLEEGERVVSGPYQSIRELEDGSRVDVTAVDTVGARAGTRAAADGGGGS